MRVLFLSGAQAQLKSIHTCIARDNAEAASAVIARVEMVAEFLGENRGTGYKLPGGRLRRFPMRSFPYLIYDEVSGETVQIVRVCYAALFRRAFHEAVYALQR
jgi:plasmid stabilization system protein ParE